MFSLESWVESNHFQRKPLESWVELVQFLGKPHEPWSESIQNISKVSWFEWNKIESYPSMVLDTGKCKEHFKVHQPSPHPAGVFGRTRPARGGGADSDLQFAPKLKCISVSKKLMKNKRRKHVMNHICPDYFARKYRLWSSFDLRRHPTWLLIECQVKVI